MQKQTSRDIDNLKTKTLQTLRVLHPDLPPTVNTERLAELFGVKPDSVRRALCVTGSFHGLRPVKLPSNRHRWPLV